MVVHLSHTAATGQAVLGAQGPPYHAGWAEFLRTEANARLEKKRRRKINERGKEGKKDFNVHMNGGGISTSAMLMMLTHRVFSLMGK